MRPSSSPPSEHSARQANLRTASSGGGASSTLTDRIADDLREQILSGELSPGSRIIVDDLRATYGSSHIPIREAIQRLEGEALLVREPHRGTYVAELYPQEAGELFDVRLLIEPTVAARSLERRTVDDIEQARRMLQTLERTSATDLPVEFQALHQQFHWDMLLPGMSPTIESVLRPVWRRIEWHLRQLYLQDVTQAVGRQQHRAMLEAWERGDRLFIDLIRSHLEAAWYAYQSLSTEPTRSHLEATWFAYQNRAPDGPPAWPAEEATPRDEGLEIPRS